MTTMELDLTKTYTFLKAYEALPRVTSFLKDRYFPTNDQTDIFNTDEVLVDFKDNGKAVAPFVVPNVGGVLIARNGYTTSRFEPCLVAVSRKLTIDDLKKRGFGEAIFSNLTPAQRETMVTLRDVNELDQMTTRREEIMAAETLINDKCVMLQYNDETGTTTTEKSIQFHDGDTNPFQYAPSVMWDASGAKILQDIQAMVRMLTDKGLPAEELVVSGDVADTIINDPTIQKLLDNKRMEFGGVSPLELPNGAAHICTLNVFGKMIKVIAYTETYEDKDGKLQSYIPSGTVILTAPAAGRGLYGCITQLEFTDGAFHSYKGRRVPLYMPDFQNNIRKVTLSTAPVLIPKCKGAWISAKVLTV